MMTKGIDVLKSHLGLQEIKNKEQIMQLLQSEAIDGDIAIDPATTPWCAASVNYAERASGHKGNGKLNARSFLTYGIPVELKDIQYGDIMVFARGSNGWEGHVAYYDHGYNKDSNIVYTASGNQGAIGEISIERQDLHKLLGVRRS